MYTVYKGLTVITPLGNHIEEENILFPTGQIELTCRSMLQATSGSIHGALTTPQAKV